MTTTNTDTNRPSARGIAINRLDALLSTDIFLITPDRDQIEKVGSVILAAIGCGEKSICIREKKCNRRAILLTERKVIVLIRPGYKCAVISEYYDEAIHYGDFWEINPSQYSNFYKVAQNIIQL